MKEFLAAHNAEYCTDRLSYPDQRNTTEFTTHSISCEAFPCHEGGIPTGREFYYSSLFRMNQKRHL
jgi:hypothetical protein